MELGTRVYTSNQNNAPVSAVLVALMSHIILQWLYIWSLVVSPLAIVKIIFKLYIYISARICLYNTDVAMYFYSISSIRMVALS